MVFYTCLRSYAHSISGRNLTSISVVAVCLSVVLIATGCAGGKIICINETGWWTDSQFHNSYFPFKDALNNASADDIIAIYKNNKLARIVRVTHFSTTQTQLLLENWLGVFVGALFVVTASFGLILYAGYRSNRRLNKGEMRRAIAGAFIVGIHCLLIIALVFNIERDVVIGAYLGGISSIMGFYFGSRTLQQQQEGNLEIENVEFKDGKVVVSVRNRCSMDVVVDAVYIGGKHFDLKEEIPSGSVKHIELDFKWESGKYKVKVCTSEGLKAEENFSSPAFKS